MAGNRPEHEWVGQQPKGFLKRWQRKQIAYLSDKIIDTTLIRISTESPPLTAEIEVRRSDERSYSSGTRTERYNTNWELQKEQGNNPALSRLAGNLIHLASIPQPDTRHGEREIRPYPDILYKDGELEVKVLGAGNVVVDWFNLGKVTGLTVVSEGEEIPIW
jgi:hypothetical protein